MNANDYWRLFIETGAPEAYLMYSNQRKSEADYVYDDFVVPTVLGVLSN